MPRKPGKARRSLPTGGWPPNSDREDVRMTCPRRLSALIAMLVVTGCVEEDTEWLGRVTDSAGVTVVANPESGLWGKGDAWSVVEELRIGVSEGEPEYLFGAISGIDASGGGDIYVLDRQARTVRVFSPEGTFLRSITGPGEGPGELGRIPNMVAVGPGDTIVVADPPRGLHRYGPSGAHLGTEPFARLASSSQFRWRVTSNGEIAMHAREFYTFVGANPVAVGDLSDPIVLFSADLSAQDTLLRVPIPASRAPATGQSDCGLQVYGEQVVWDVDAERALHIASTTRYSLSTYAGGVLTRVVRKSPPLRSLSQDGRESVRRAVAERWRRNRVPPDRIRQMSERMCFPAALPPIAAVRAGPEGTLWVSSPIAPASLLSGAGGGLPGSVLPIDLGTVPSPEWDVFDREGRFLGTLSLPPLFRPFAFRGNLIYGAWEDESGVPYVLRLRVVR